MCLCNEQVNKFLGRSNAQWNPRGFIFRQSFEENNQLLPKVITDPDVSACCHQGTAGLSYIYCTTDVDYLNHLTY